MRTSAAGMTRLFDSVSQVSRDLEARQGKKAMVVFTDGDDNASVLTSAGASRRAINSGVPIYIIAQGSALKDAKLMKVLEDMAANTGGIAFRLTKPEKIGEVFAEISRNLRHTYLLSWKFPEGAGTSWHAIKIAVDGDEDARIRARQGYWPN
jgi:VWFA-related protein